MTVLEGNLTKKAEGCMTYQKRMKILGRYNRSVVLLPNLQSVKITMH